jgi:hypothetical protein
MPVLHRYKDKEKYYVLTSISGKIVTFQLTAEGHEKLLKSGIKNEERFGRALLFDLYRTGDAFTHGAGPGKLEVTDKRQLALDFADDPEPESIFPSCSVCSSIMAVSTILCKFDKGANWVAPFLSDLISKSTPSLRI